MTLNAPAKAAIVGSIIFSIFCSIYPDKVRAYRDTTRATAMDIATGFVTGLATLNRFRRSITDSSRQTGQESSKVRGHGVQAGTQTELIKYASKATPIELPTAAETGQETLPKEPLEQVLGEDALAGPEYTVQSDPGVVDEQELRNQVYIAFDEEGATEDDFTAGPARLVIASDGVKECAALLLTMDLSTRVKDAIDAHIGYTKDEQRAIEESEYLWMLKSNIEGEIAGHELRLPGPDNDDADQESTHKLRGELKNLQELLENVTDRQASVDDVLRGQARNLRGFQTKVMACLKDAFAVANLIKQAEDEPPPPVERRTLEEEYRHFCKQRQEVYDYRYQSDAGSEHALNITRDEDLAPLPPKLTSEEQVFYQARDNFYDAQHQLQNTRARFERREFDREAEREVSKETREEFDLRWVDRYAQVTRELVAAEEALAQAKGAALAVGVDIYNDDQSSGFAGDKGDGYRSSQEASCIAAAPLSKILPWLETMPDDAVVDDVDSRDPEMDDWDAADVEIGDSSSCIMTGTRRRKVERYRRQCEGLR